MAPQSPNTMAGRRGDPCGVRLRQCNCSVCWLVEGALHLCQRPLMAFEQVGPHRGREMAMLMFTLCSSCSVSLLFARRPPRALDGE